MLGSSSHSLLHNPNMYYTILIAACTAWLDYRNAQRYERLRDHIHQRPAPNEPSPYIDWYSMVRNVIDRVPPPSKTS